MKKEEKEDLEIDFIYLYIKRSLTSTSGCQFTRLALQLLLVEVFTLLSFQLQDFYQDLYCYLLSLSPRIEIG